MLMKFGNSWKSWTTSLSIDVLAQLISKYALSQPQYKDKVGEVVDEELSTRESNLTYYLLKSPAFEKIIKPLMEKIIQFVSKIPLLGGLFSTWLEFMLIVQQYFYYSEV
jgi:hypothetical protein